MKKLFISPSGLDARGVGPRIMLATAPFLAAAIYFEIMSAPFAEIFPGKSNLTVTIGWILMVIGIAAFLVTMVQFVANFPKGKLITSGMFACSRNPIYATWTLFILPAAGMICNNWIFFCCSPGNVYCYHVDGKGRGKSTFAGFWKTLYRLPQKGRLHDPISLICGL
jgi:protein-S-isoprenylcysteine O-methyltransferase Ste14